MEMAEIIVTSSVVYLLNVSIIALVNKSNIGFNVTGSFVSMTFLIKYIILTLLTTILFTCINHFIIRKYINKLCNFYNSKTNRNQELLFPTVWENIFEDNQFVDLVNTHQVVSIEKSGKMISCGYIQVYPAPQTSCNEIALSFSKEIYEYFESDKEETSDEKKIFNKTILEYYNLEYDVLIKFYDMSKYNEFLNQVTSCSAVEEE